MLYSLHEAQHMALAPWRYLAELSRGWFGHPFSPLIYMPLAKRVAASSELFLRVTERYEKPKWNLADVPDWVAKMHTIYFPQTNVRIKPRDARPVVIETDLGAAVDRVHIANRPSSR